MFARARLFSFKKMKREGVQKSEKNTCAYAGCIHLIASHAVDSIEQAHTLYILLSLTKSSLLFSSLHFKLLLLISGIDRYGDRFSAAFEAHGYEDTSDILMTGGITPSLLAAVVRVGGGRAPQVQRMLKQCARAGLLADTEAITTEAWLDDVQQGYADRFVAGFAHAGYETADDVKAFPPTAALVRAIVEDSGGRAPQVHRVTSGLEELVGMRLEQPMLPAPAPASPSRLPSGAALPTAPSTAAVPAPEAAASPSSHSTATPAKGIFQLTAINSPATPAAAAAAIKMVQAVPVPHDGGADGADGADARTNEAPASASASASASRAQQAPGDASPSTTARSTARPRRNSQLGTSVLPKASTITAAAASTAAAATGPLTVATPAPETDANANAGGSNAAATSTSAAAGLMPQPKLPSTGGLRGLKQHCMLSYNWNHQPIVKETRDRLVSLGFPCWLDIDNMEQDIYDSMAAGRTPTAPPPPLSPLATENLLENTDGTPHQHPISVHPATFYAC